MDPENFEKMGRRAINWFLWHLCNLEIIILSSLILLSMALDESKHDPRTCGLMESF